VLEQPLQLLFTSSAAGQLTASFPRLLILAEQGSQATVVETHLAANGDPSLSVPVTELVVEPGARVDHYRLHTAERFGFHVGELHAALGPGGELRSHLFLLGTGWVREDVRVRFEGEGGRCALDGLYLGTGQQHLDIHTLVDHAVPRCTSEEVFRGVLAQSATGVFNGRVLVRRDAQKSSTRQTHKGLLLSKDAVVNAQPQLEILADDVKATHGAAVGQLDEDALFYLRSRGLAVDSARRLLVQAFAAVVLDRVELPPLRRELDGLLARRLDGVWGGGDAWKVS
jgi:Fe-S cluster assembly protein SufD